MNATPGTLRLKAEDAEDFRILAACLQDALVPVGDMKFDAGAGEFVLVANRFRWEDEGGTGKGGQRIHSALHFSGVKAVRRRGFDLRERARTLDLLTIEAAADAVTLLFADDAAIRLEGAGIGGRLRDLGEAWPAAATPRHPAA
jgi:hypothetical protein